MLFMQEQQKVLWHLDYEFVKRDPAGVSKVMCPQTVELTLDVVILLKYTINVYLYFHSLFHIKFFK